MKQVPLYKGQRLIAWANVSDEDYADVICWLWRHLRPGYAVRYVEGTGKPVLMHRQLMNLTAGDGCEVDHKDGDGLNNQRENLRVCTHAQNMQNRRDPGGGGSRFRGVHWDAARSLWVASVKVKGQQVYMARFADEAEAARAASDQRAIHLPFANSERD